MKCSILWYIFYEIIFTYTYSYNHWRRSSTDTRRKTINRRHKFWQGMTRPPNGLYDFYSTSKGLEQPYTRITWPYVASQRRSARTTITSDFHTHVHSMKTGPSPIREPHTPRTENSHEKNSSSQFNKVLDWRNAGTSSLAPTAAS